MAMTKIQQLQISGTLASRVSDSVSNANLQKSNRTLEDDLNSLRTQVKLIIGGGAWTSSLSGSQDLADIYSALRIDPISGIANFQNNVFVTGSLSASVNLQVGGNISLAGNLDSDLDEAKTLFGTVTTDANTITLGGGGLVVTAGDLKVGGNDIKASDNTVALTLAGANVSVAGALDVGGGFGSTGVTISSTGNIAANGTLSVDGNAAIGGDLTVGGNDIKSSGGDTAITLSGANVIIPGDLTVNGIATTINTTNLEIKDSVVGLGFASGTVQQSLGDRGWIGGLVGEENVAFFWDESESEFAVARTTNSATGSLPIPIASYSNFRAAEISGSIFKASMGVSGSLTQLTDGRSYLTAGPGISIVSSSNGQISISNTGGSGAAKGYLLGTSAHISSSNGVVTFGPAGANIGTLTSAADSKIDIFLNGIFMAFGFDVTAITTTTFTFDSTIVSTLTSDDVLSIVLRDTI